MGGGTGGVARIFEASGPDRGHILGPGMVEGGGVVVPGVAVPGVAVAARLLIVVAMIVVAMIVVAMSGRVDRIVVVDPVRSGLDVAVRVVPSEM